MTPELIIVPEFALGSSYRELSHVEGRDIYRWITLRAIRVPMRGLVTRDTSIVYRDAKGREWMRMDKFGILIARDYAWNGCSPKRWLPVLGWVGTPDLKCTLLASLVHDTLYQFHPTRHFPLDRAEADAVFREIIEESGNEGIASTYYHAVREFGSWSPGNEEGVRSEIL
ncbi:MAG: DUF1353 domain-containing protein [Luteolibacter sp.]